jgi:hypothetical protein
MDQSMEIDCPKNSTVKILFIARVTGSYLFISSKTKIEKRKKEMPYSTETNNSRTPTHKQTTLTGIPRPV